jgi:hypothetical protein
MPYVEKVVGCYSGIVKYYGDGEIYDACQQPVSNVFLTTRATTEASSEMVTQTLTTWTTLDSNDIFVSLI